MNEMKSFGKLIPVFFLLLTFAACEPIDPEQGNEDHNGNLNLRIISVRPWVSAAVPVSGGLERITPGMRFTAAHRTPSGGRTSPWRLH